MSTKRTLLKKSALQNSLDLFEQITNETELTKDQAIQATENALVAVNVDPNFISYDIGVLPDSTGATEGIIGAYYTNDNIWQILEWDGSEWEEIGEPISTKRYVDDKASLSAFSENSYEASLQGRTRVFADQLVSLDIGDDKSKDNTNALQELMDRPTAKRETVIFPNGVLYHNDIEIKPGVHWAGRGTVFKWKDQEFVGAPNKAPFMSDGAHNFIFKNFTIDARKDSHNYDQTTGTSSIEGLDIENTNFARLENVVVENSIGDGIDIDTSHHNKIVNCVVRNCEKDGIHVSWGSTYNQILHNYCYGCGYAPDRLSPTGTPGGRGGITQTDENDAHGNVYIGNESYNNYPKNYSIRGRDAVFANNRSGGIINYERTRNEDELDGALYPEETRLEHLALNAPERQLPFYLHDDYSDLNQQLENSKFIRRIGQLTGFYMKKNRFGIYDVQDKAFFRRPFNLHPDVKPFIDNGVVKLPPLSDFHSTYHDFDELEIWFRCRFSSIFDENTEGNFQVEFLGNRSDGDYVIFNISGSGGAQNRFQIRENMGSGLTTIGSEDVDGFPTLDEFEVRITQQGLQSRVYFNDSLAVEAQITRVPVVGELAPGVERRYKAEFRNRLNNSDFLLKELIIK